MKDHRKKSVGARTQIQTDLKQVAQIELHPHYDPCEAVTVANS